MRRFNKPSAVVAGHRLEAYATLPFGRSSDVIKGSQTAPAPATIGMANEELRSSLGAIVLVVVLVLDGFPVA